MRDASNEISSSTLNFNLLKRKAWAKDRKPISAFLEITPRCNMNCIHCYLQDHHCNSEMSLERIIEIIDILYDKGILFLTLSGGEIFTRKDFADIYLYAKRKGFIVELFSNGLNIDDEVIDILRKYPPLLMDISLYGSCEETYYQVTGVRGACEQVRNNCRMLAASNIRLSLKSPIIKETRDEVEGMREFADSIGVPFCVTYEIDATIDRDSKTKDHQLDIPDMLRCEFADYERFGDPSNRTNTDIDGIYPIANDSVFICNVAQTSFVIDYEGKMCPCMKFRHRGVELTRENFDKIWEDFGKLQHYKASPAYKCSKCEARYYCDACAAEREMLYGDLEAVNEEVCKYAAARHAYYVKKWPLDKVLTLLK